MTHPMAERDAVVTAVQELIEAALSGHGTALRRRRAARHPQHRPLRRERPGRPVARAVPVGGHRRRRVCPAAAHLVAPAAPGGGARAQVSLRGQVR